ncbi:hypothetical protein QA599_20125 [Haloarculaceae archaeon H-GB1-1]|nr:hypothetical protein [Haloarculaceae archaeon H-GB1-1]
MRGSVDDDGQFALDAFEGFLVSDVVVFRWPVSSAQIERAVILTTRVLGGFEFSDPFTRNGIGDKGSGSLPEVLCKFAVGIDLETTSRDRITVLVEPSPHRRGAHARH